MNEKKQYPRFEIKKAEAKYPKLLVPEKYNESENKSVPDPTGDYTVSLVIEPSLLPDEFINTIDSLANEIHKEATEAVKEAAKKKNKQPYDVECKLPYEYTEDGKIVLKLKQKAQQVSKTTGEVFDRKVKMFDAAGNEFEPKSIRSGSIMSANITMVPWKVSAIKSAGVTLFINAIKIHKLLTGQDSSDFFSDDEEYLEEQREMLNELNDDSTEATQEDALKEDVTLPDDEDELPF